MQEFIKKTLNLRGSENWSGGLLHSLVYGICESCLTLYSSYSLYQDKISTVGKSISLPESHHYCKNFYLLLLFEPITKQLQFQPVVVEGWNFCRTGFPTDWTPGVHYYTCAQFWCFWLYLQWLDTTYRIICRSESNHQEDSFNLLAFGLNSKWLVSWNYVRETNYPIAS